MDRSSPTPSTTQTAQAGRARVADPAAAASFHTPVTVPKSGS
jgi:hypothetical protein